MILATPEPSPCLLTITSGHLEVSEYWETDDAIFQRVEDGILIEMTEQVTVDRLFFKGNTELTITMEGWNY